MNNKHVLPLPQDKRSGGLLPPEVMRSVISVKTGIPTEFVGLHVDGQAVTWWDTRALDMRARLEGGAA